MAGMVIVAKISTYVSGHQPMHPSAEVSIAVRLKHKMEMVGHQAIGNQAHWHSHRRLDHCVEERLVVFSFMKDLGAGVATIEDVITKIPLRGPNRSRHDVQLRNTQNTSEDYPERLKAVRI